MKKIVILASVLMLIGVSRSIAGESDMFFYDAVAVENEMAQLVQLEGYVLDNPGITISEMTSLGNNLSLLLSNPSETNGFNLLNEKVFGIPGFLWGCVFNVFGVALVYFVGQDKQETKMAIIGCVVAGLVGVGYSVVRGVLGYGYWYW
jgi:hypothetical protein